MHLSYNKNFLTFLVLFIIGFTAITVYYISSEQKTSITQKQALEKVEQLEKSIKLDSNKAKRIGDNYKFQIEELKKAIKTRREVSKSDLNIEIEKIKETLKER